MTSDEIFVALDANESLTKNRGLLKAFLREQLNRYHQDPTSGEEIAYGIAGLINAQSIALLPDSDPYQEIIRLAADLELPPQHRDSESTWERFATLVHALPESS